MKKISNFFNENFSNKIRITSKTKIRISLFISIIGLLCLIAGSSYAIFQYNIESSNKQIINVGKVRLVLTESVSGISFDNVIEMTDEEGFNQSDYYSFSISNIGDTPAEYDLLLVSDTTKTKTLDEKFIKVGLEVNNDKVKIVNLNDANNIIHSTVISKGEDIQYKLRIWIDPDALENDSVEEDETISLKLKVNATQYMGESNLKNTAYNTIKSQVKTMNISYKYINDANVTENGITYNNGDNGVFLFDGTDDNGGSLPIYYYRGNVTNNNVIFGGFCWKIVRTTSTGGTKLIYNGVPSDDGACNNTGTASRIGTSKFNSSNSPAYVGYMYGTVYEDSYKDITGVTDEIIYGNDVTYSNGAYTLVTTKTSTSWSSDYKTLANGYHYTCFSSDTTCSSVYYITYFDGSNNTHYLTFTGGDNLDSAKEKMYTNETDSTMKTYIDNWYSTNLTSYTNVLENTIFCNDRTSASDEVLNYKVSSSYYTINGGALASKDTNAVSNSYFKSFENTIKGTPSLQCTNRNDRFSLSVANGGTEGFGNNALTYPIGLLTLDEANLAGGQHTSNSNYYLPGGTTYLVLSPASWYKSESGVGRVTNDGTLLLNSVHLSLGVRPVISLKQGTEFVDGTDGTVSNPYVVKVS